MGYSIGLKTNSTEQADEILSFMENNIPALRPDTHHPITWCTGKDLSYIQEVKSIGSNDTPTDMLESIYFYTILYHIAVKYKLTQTINNVECVILNYDDMEEFCLAKTNPYPEGHEKFYTFAQMREDGIRQWRSKGIVGKLFGLEPNKKEIKFFQDLIKTIELN